MTASGENVYHISAEQPNEEQLRKLLALNGEILILSTWFHGQLPESVISKNGLGELLRSVKERHQLQPLTDEEMKQLVKETRQFLGLGIGSVIVPATGIQELDYMFKQEAAEYHWRVVNLNT